MALTMVVTLFSFSAFAAEDKKSSNEITLEKLLPKALYVDKTKSAGLRGDVKVAVDFPSGGGVLYLPGSADTSKLCFSWVGKDITFSKDGKTFKSGKAPIAPAGKKVTYTVRLAKVFPDGKEVNQQREVFPGNQRSEAFALFEKLKKSRPGIEAVQDTQKKQWEK